MAGWTRARLRKPGGPARFTGIATGAACLGMHTSVIAFQPR